MARHLDLDKLRTLDAAARHLSFTRAGDELNISQSAVSQQIRILESDLGVMLFVRRVRALDLTEEGKRLAAVARTIIEQAELAIVDIMGKSPRGRLAISCLPAFSTFWLAPRIAGFSDRFPRVSVHLMASSKVADFRSDDVDLAIRWGRGPWPHTRSCLLFREAYVPVCTPRMAEDRGLAAPEALAEARLLFDMEASQTLWSAWFDAAGLNVTPPDPVLSFETTADLISAAEAGRGVALVRRGLIRRAVRAGRLVCPLPQALPTENGYHLVHAPSRSRDPRVAAFREWILAEAAKEPHDGR